MAPEGHFFMHIPQEMQRDGSIATLPRERAHTLAGTAGYLLVAGFLSVVRTAVFTISKYDMFLSPLHAPDAGVYAEHNNGHVRELTPSEHLHERGEVRERGSPDS